MVPETIASPASIMQTRLNRRWLIPARFFWLALVLVALGLFTVGLSAHYEDIQSVYQGGIQVWLSQNQRGEVVIGTGGAAAHAGVLERDVLIAVNDVPVTSKEQAETLLAGKVGTPVTVTVQTGHFPARQVTIIRDSETGRVLQQWSLSADFAMTFALASEILFAGVCIVIGFAIFWRRSDDWLALLVSLTFIMVLMGVSLPVLALYFKDMVWQRQSLLDVWFAIVMGMLIICLYLFPDGKFVPPVTVILTGLLVIWTLRQLFDPALYPWRMTPRNFIIVQTATLSTGVLSMIYRYRYHSDKIQRSQIRWIVWGASAAVLGLLLQVLPLTFDPLQVSPLAFDVTGQARVQYDFIQYPVGQLLKLLFPISIAFAIRRHRLWNIDILINRAIVYGALTTIIIGIYVLVVGILGTTIQGRGNLLISILATGLIAVLVQPLRDRLQRGVNRMMYGERDDPVTVLSRLGQRLEGTLAPDAVLPSLVETVAQTLKLPYVAIETMTENRSVSQPAADSSSIGLNAPRIAHGNPQPEVIRFPLIYQSETIGQLLVAPRAPGEMLSSMDRHLLQNIAHQAGMAVHAVNLTADLQRSRQHLVTTREEERRRLRRDLHDGLGPNLASQGLKLAAVKRLAEKDPASAIPLLEQVMTQNQSTVEEVRRLVYGLRPPALDELGLVAAIRDHVAGMDGKSTLQIEITEPVGGLPPLSAAVEVAAYRIVLEALTNVIRHAQAKHCAIRFSSHQNGSSPILQIEIVDDGIGLPRDLRAGVGLRSMRERAEEVGGILTIEPAINSGTHIRARLPLIDTLVHSAS
jgi:signal transduction histidine kinase